MMEVKKIIDEKDETKTPHWKFWILEHWEETESEDKGKENESKDKGKKDKDELVEKLTAWVFDTETDAISKLQELIKNNIDKMSMDEMGKAFNLQEVEIIREKYNMTSVSWMKIAFGLIAGK